MTTAEFLLPLRYTPSERLTRTLASLTVIGAVITALGLILDPQRTLPHLLLAGYFGVGLSLGSALFIALQHVSNAGWGVAIRRIPEAMASALPLFGALVLVAFVGTPALYAWSQPSAPASDHHMLFRSWWLNTPFFVGRAACYVAVWWYLTRKLVRLSRLQDAGGTPDLTGTSRRYAAVFIVVFGVTISLASFDWIMSLEPHWYSTIFGVYNFAGLFLASLAAITLLVIYLRRSGPLDGIVSSDHLHNLGKLIFAFSTFWMYIWFSQYLLIWYANIPEEAVYFVRRQQGSWTIFTVVNLLFNWVIPFIVLLSQRAKKSETTMIRICIVLLIGRWMDLFWMILPPFMPANPTMGLWECGPVVCVTAAFLYVVLKILAQGNMIPLNDPLLVESVGPHH